MLPFPNLEHFYALNLPWSETQLWGKNLNPVKQDSPFLYYNQENLKRGINKIFSDYFTENAK